MVSIKCPLVFPNFHVAREKRGWKKPWLLVKLSWLEETGERDSSPRNIKYILGRRKSNKRQSRKSSIKFPSVEKDTRDPPPLRKANWGEGEGETDARTRELKKNTRACTNCWLTRQAWLLPFAKRWRIPSQIGSFRNQRGQLMRGMLIYVKCLCKCKPSSSHPSPLCRERARNNLIIPGWEWACRNPNLSESSSASFATKKENTNFWQCSRELLRMLTR